MAFWDITVSAGSTVGSGTDVLLTTISGVVPGDFDGATINSVIVQSSPTVTSDGTTDDTIGIRFFVTTTVPADVFGSDATDAASMCYASLGASVASATITDGSSRSPNPTTAVAADWDEIRYSINYTAFMKNDAETISWSSFTVRVDYTPSTSKEINGLLGEINLEGFAPTVEVVYEPTVFGQVGTLNFESAHDSLPVTYVYTINPQYGAINVEGFAPTVVTETGGQVDVTSLLGEKNLEGFAPTVDLIRTIEGPANGELNLEGFAPTVEVIYEPTFFGQLGELNLVGFAPTADVVFEPSFAPTFGTLNLEGFAATVDVVYEPTFAPSFGPLNLEGFAPTVEIAERTIYPAFGTVNAEGFAPTVQVIREPTVEPAVGYINTQGFIPAVTGEGEVEALPQLGVVNADGSIATIQIERTARPSHGELNLEGFAGSFTRQATVIAFPALGELHLEGFAGAITTVTISVAEPERPESRGGGGMYPEEEDELDVILMVIQKFLEDVA